MKIDPIELPNHFFTLMRALDVRILAYSIQSGGEGVESVVEFFTTREGLDKLASTYRAEIVLHGRTPIDEIFFTSSSVPEPGYADSRPLFRHTTNSAFTKEPINIEDKYILFPYSPSNYGEEL
ncbi:hypothetical protein HYW21_04605 [Candidatus Woesearchaeota archaeon]|nr:hypothetical protein [Candidatus Woesearchaeota archaeon]